MTKESTINNPNENLKVPDWLNEQIFKKVLQQDVPDYAKVLKFTPVAAVPPGGNFTSQIFRVYIDLELNDGKIIQKSYIFKTVLADEEISNFLDPFFKKELLMYKEYLPAFEALYRKAGRDVQLTPKCFHTEQIGKRINFIFEDLSVKKFSNIDRTQGLDMIHMTYSLKKLAEFHAASVVYENDNGAYPDEFNEGMVMKSGKDFIIQAFESKLDAFKNTLQSSIPEYANVLPNKAQYWNMCSAIFDTDENKFNVLTHGDFWSSNIMFRNNSANELEEILMVDFQICKWGSPAADLIFIITTSAAKDIRIKYFDYFVEIYHKHLVDCLKVLNYRKNIPKLRDIQMSLYEKENAFYAFFALMNHLPLILFPTDKNSNLNTIMDESEEGEKFRIRLFSNPSYCEIIKDFYPFYCRRGIIDFVDF